MIAGQQKSKRTFQEIMAPCYRLRPTQELTDAQANRIRALSGPRIYRKGGWAGTIEAPDNVGWLVERVCGEMGVGLQLVQAPYYSKELTWEEVRDRLLVRGEVTPEALAMLFDYQQEGITFCTNRGSAKLWYPGGAGKTITMLLSLLSLTRAPTPLVIVTKAAVRRQWASAVQQFTRGIEPYVISPMGSAAVGDIPDDARGLLAVPGLAAKTINRLYLEAGVKTVEDLKEAIALGTLLTMKRFGKKKIAQIEGSLRRLRPVQESLAEYMERMRIARSRPVVIVAWTSLREQWETLAKILGGYGALGLDELHTSKSAKRQRVKVTPEGESTYTDLGNLASSAAKLVRAAKYRIGATATGITDRLRDLWAQWDMIEPGSAGTFGTWARRYCAATEGVYGGLITSGVSTENLDELNDRLSFFTHRVDYARSHAALLHLKRRESWRLGIDELGEGWSPEKVRTELKQARLRGASALLEVQIAAASSQVREALCDRVENDIEANPNAKVCILDIRHDNVDQLAETLTKTLDGVEVLCVHGGNTTPESRNKIREYYMAHEGPIVLVATGESVGTGYDLHDTDIAYLAALPWTPGALHQWEARFFRHNMRRPCRMVYAIPQGSVVENIAARILAKMPSVEKVTQDAETAGAVDVLGGTDDKEKLAREILAVLGSIDETLVTDDD